MLNTEEVITKIRNLVANGTSLTLTNVYTPYLPQEGENIACITLLTGSTTNDLCGNIYNDLTFRILVRGTANDTTTRALVDEIFNAIHMQQRNVLTSGAIINIFATTTPTYIGIDENERILYNITFTVKVEGE